VDWWIVSLRQKDLRWWASTAAVAGGLSGACSSDPASTSFTDRDAGTGRIATGAGGVNGTGGSGGLHGMAAATARDAAPGDTADGMGALSIDDLSGSGVYGRTMTLKQTPVGIAAPSWLAIRQ